jgi:predicted RNA-binding Zn-ribbon protein involved in translation (DUF1610 family)
MINRTYIKCNTCNQPITLRVTIAQTKDPEYHFPCNNCGEEIVIGMAIDFENVSFEYIYKNNCIPGNEEGHIVNLGAHIPIDESLIHKDGFSPFLTMDRSLFGTKKMPFSVPLQFKSNWENLSKAWSQTLKGNKDLALLFLNKYKFIYIEQERGDLFDIIHDFCMYFLLPAPFRYIQSALLQIGEGIRMHPKEYNNFFDSLFIEDAFKNLFPKYLAITKTYMDNYDSLSPLLLYLQSEKEFKGDLTSSSFHFSSLKGFYGDIYELIADAFIFLACINNLNNARPFDSFEQMDLIKYQTLDKANRTNSFKANKELIHFASEFNSKIRNASHHGNISLNGRIIEYHAGRPLKKYEMTRGEYIKVINQIFINALGILDILLYLNQIRKKFTGKSFII